MVILTHKRICELLNLFNEMNTIVSMWRADVLTMQSGEHKYCIIWAEWC